MKNHKSPNRFLSLVALGLGAMYVVAQPTFAEPGADGQKSEKRAGKRGGQAHQLAAHLNLTDEQQATLKPIFESSRTRMQELRKNKEIAPEQKREQMKQIRTETDTQFNAVLTEEQRVKLAELRAQHKAQRGNKAKKTEG